ncbi:MAG: exodeoxyribonuclease VII small subunit [Paludibacteraceae bacterium]|jgi:exodeoxyribonuclease VII small subunit|nr:exodeoxyribonuclease VII small subunit [Paludibacteraceae bacterium]MDI9536360.1 exodeoxyribonuclease VII small subunit [Bacteroidota bacterium]HHT60716.1 exodeoxyribonuclease VII small subunit [Bacteroidales bacterium]MBP9039821.1 exodeoxyribonuclease VII small subunit [Paludibacteraceae bacterium]HOA46764.1 exodeoxyribonuclease VII small subunit [Paludibacteraceae bacterium]
MKATKTYQQAMDELDAIVSQIENDELSIDELSSKIKKASELITFCKDKLRKTDEEVEKMLNDIEL